MIYTNSSFDMRQSWVLSIGLHLGLALLIVVVSLWRPYEPPLVDFQELEIIDTQTFEALVAQSEAGNSGSDEADGQTGAQSLADAGETAPLDEQTSNQDIVSESDAEPVAPPEPAEVVNPEPLAPPEPAVQPDNLPEPIFTPDQSVEPQPLVQAEEADRSGIAEATSEGQEQAVEVTTIPEPPARDAAELRQIASEASDQPSDTPQAEIVVEESAEAQENTEAQAEAEVDATSGILPEASEDAPISAAPAVAITPPARPTGLAEVEDNREINNAASNAQSDSAQAAAEDAPATTPSQTELVDSEAQETPSQIVSDGSANAATEGSEPEPTVDDLLASVLAEDDGTQKAGRGLSRIEEASLKQKIHNNWVKTPLIEKDNYQDLVVTVRFVTDVNGHLNGDVRLIHPQLPSEDYKIAFEAARRAIYESMPLEMPADIDPNGVVWTIVFDPASPVGQSF